MQGQRVAVAGRGMMIDRSRALEVARQARVRGAAAAAPTNCRRYIAIMQRIDEAPLDFPFTDSRMLRDLLTHEGIRVGRCTSQRS